MEVRVPGRAGALVVALHGGQGAWIDADLRAQLVERAGDGDVATANPGAQRAVPWPGPYESQAVPAHERRGQ